MTSRRTLSIAVALGSLVGLADRVGAANTARSRRANTLDRETAQIAATLEPAGARTIRRVFDRAHLLHRLEQREVRSRDRRQPRTFHLEDAAHGARR